MKKVLSIILVFAIVVGLLPTITTKTLASAEGIWDGTVADGFYSGTGTASDPYIISCAEELAYLSEAYNAGELKADAKFLLCNDIWLNNITEKIESDLTASQISQYNLWTPINSFKGQIDGNGYTIYGLVTNNVEYGGFIGSMYEYSTVYNLNIENSYVSATTYAGSIVGWMDTTGNGVYKCSSNAYVKGDNSCGGISGYNNAGYLYCCEFDGTVVSEKYAGGMCGYFRWASMVYCFNKGNIYGKNYSGGLCGTNAGSKLTECYNAGPISGGGSVDALSGSCGGEIEDCYFIKDFYSSSGYSSAKGIALGNSTLESSYPGYDFVKIWAIDETVNSGLPHIRMQLQPVNWYVFSNYSNTDNELEYPLFDETSFSLLLKYWISKNRNVDVRDYDFSDEGLKNYLYMTIDAPVVDSSNITYSIEGETMVKDVIAYLLFAANAQAYMSTVMSDVSQKISENDSDTAYTFFLDSLKNFNTQYFAFQQNLNEKDTFNKTLDILKLSSLAVDFCNDKIKGVQYLTSTYKMIQNESPEFYDDIEYYILSGGDTKYLNKYYTDSLTDTESLADLSQIVKNGKSTISISQKYADGDGIIGSVIDLSLDNLSYIASKTDSKVADEINEIKSKWDSVSDYMDVVKLISSGSLLGIAAKSFEVSLEYIEEVKAVYEGKVNKEAGWYALSYYYFGKNNPDALEGMFDKDTGDAIFDVNRLAKYYSPDYSDPIQRQLAIYYEKNALLNYSYKPDADFRLYLSNAADVIIKTESINCTEYQDMLVKYINAEINLSNGSYGNTIQLDVISNNQTMGNVSGSGIYSFGDNVTIVATPVEGAEFVGWVDKTTGETLSINETYSFEIFKDMCVQAIFEVGELQPAEIPTILSQSGDVSYHAGVQANNLTVAASVSDGGTLTVNWYKNTSKSTIGSVCVGDSFSITPDTTQTGTYYYYPIIKNTVTSSFDSSVKTSSVKKGSYIKVIIKNPVAVGINVSSLPTQTDYVVMEEFDETGLVVNLEYSNGTYQTLTDYNLSYDFSSAGNKQVTVSFMGFSAECDVSVKERNIFDTNVAEIEQQLYSGSPCTPKPIVIYEKTGEILVENTDYILSYSSNDGVGIGKITITGCGYYVGSKTIDFSITCETHSYIEIKTEATCFEQGYTTYNCEVCGDTYIDNYTDVLDHMYTNYVYDDNSTETDCGTITACCDNGCGSKHTIDNIKIITDSDTQAIQIAGTGILTRTHIELFIESIESIKEIIISEGIATIDDYTFDGFKNAEIIEIPNSVSAIGDYAFKNCSKIKKMLFPQSITSFGQCVLHGCSSLESLTIPFVGATNDNGGSSKTSTLFGYIFGDVEYEGSVSTRQQYNAFFYKTYYLPSALTNVTVTGGTLLYGAFSNCLPITKIVLGKDVTSIAARSFYKTNSLTKVVIPDSVTSISSSAFTGCDNLSIYCHLGSTAQTYCEENSIPFVLYQMNPIGKTEIDKNNKLIFTSNHLNNSFEDIVTATGYKLEASAISHSLLFGTGSTISVFDEEENIGDYTIIVEGDLDGDSVVDVLDAAIAQLYSAGFHEPTQNEIYAANGCISDELDVNSYQNVVNMALAS